MAQDTLGKTVFLGKGTCSACHGVEGKGSMLAPDLTDAAWLNIDGSVEAIVRLVKEGVAQPKEHPAPMPPMGGAQLTDAEVQAVAAYVKSLSAD
jgi:mono/diheme cytochrome c family protein